jgi:hypothetical protein
MNGKNQARAGGHQRHDSARMLVRSKEGEKQAKEEELTSRTQGNPVCGPF